MLHIDQSSPTPPFEQLRQQISAQIAAGNLLPGDRLPTVRRLAGDLGIAPNTVARAYRELEFDGVLTGRARAGTCVAERDVHHAAEVAAQKYAEVARAFGLDSVQALALVQQALNLT